MKTKINLFFILISSVLMLGVPTIGYAQSTNSILNVSISPNTSPYVVMPYASSKIFTATATGGTAPYNNYIWSVGENLTSTNYHRSILSQCSGYSSCNILANGLIYLYVRNNYQKNGSDVAYIFANVTDSQGNVAQSAVQIAMPLLLVTPSTITIVQGQSTTITAYWSVNTYTPKLTYAWYSGTSLNCAYDTTPVNSAISLTLTVSPTMTTIYCGKAINSSFSDTTPPVTVTVLQPTTTIPITYYTLRINNDANISNATSPASGNYASGSFVTIHAVRCFGLNCAEGDIFSNWVGSGLGSYTGTDWNQTITMNGNITETANYKFIPGTTTTTTSTTVPTTTTIPPTTPTQFTTINIKPGWNLLSTPQYLGGTDIENISNIYASLQNSCGASSNINKVLFGYDGSTNSYSLINDLGGFQTYEEYLNSATSAKLLVTGGGGYWFYSTKQCSITTTIIPLSKVYSALNGIPFTYFLTAGWNLIGVPFAVTNTFSTISSSCNIRGGFYAYNATTRSYYNATTPVVGNGYFVYANAPCTLNWTPNSGSGSPPSAP